MWNCCRYRLAASLLLAVAAATGASEIDFNRDVRPILSDKCFQCHGPDEGQRQTSLRMNEKTSLLSPLASGEYAIVPGDLAGSQVWLRITSDDPDVRMPPPDAGKTLNAAERDRLRDWIEQGAEWSDHWSFIPPQRPSLPTVKEPIRARNAIDLFVLARLDEQGLKPNPRAAPPTLIRRVTEDLTGLPPTPEEVDHFVADQRPDAYERLVDRLLPSPRYGEHRARYWLDVARYGDTHGLHLDNERSIWPYRDWVIGAFNHNQPFDQFTIEQLAGDLLPSRRLDQQVATGFNRCNVTTSEGGSIDDEYLVRYAVDRVETTATTWMGLTAGCAACHDHKFDPITQTEFYQLFAYFYNLTERAMDGNLLLPPPSVKVPTATQRVRLREIEAETTLIDRQLGAIRDKKMSELDGWIEQYQRQHPLPPIPADALLHCPLDETDGVGVRAINGADGKIEGAAFWDSGRIDGGLRLDGATHIDLGDRCGFDRNQPFSAGGWIYIDGEGAMTVLSRMDDGSAYRGYDLYLNEGQLFVHLVHQWDDNAIRVNTKQPLVRQKWQHVFFTYDGSSCASGIGIYVDGREQDLDTTHDALTDTIRTEAPFRIGRRQSSAPFVGMLDDIRVFDRRLDAREVQALAGSNARRQMMTRPTDQRTRGEQESLIDFFLARRDATFSDRLQRRRDLRDQHQRIEGRYPSSLVMQELDRPRQAHVLIRGQYDQPGPAVSAGVPAMLPPLPQGAPANRLGLARWLVDASHPLTARVAVNRIWQQYFGVGIVATTEDFGSQGEWPSHPRLLDWLAIEFIESGWDVKALHRLIVTSATYQQSARATLEQYRGDPANQMLARGPRFRMDAEMIRDQALAVSGLLVEQTGGPSVKPYQPDGLWQAVGYTSSNTARFKQDQGGDLYRRSVYTFWKRTSPPPTMQILDSPSREVCTARRPRTNTPSAALALMNDIQFVEAARQMAVRLLRKDGIDDTSRLRFGFRLVTARQPTNEEVQVFKRLLNDCRATYRQDSEGALALVTVGDSAVDRSLDSRELAAWTMVCSTLLNLDETVTK